MISTDRENELQKLVESPRIAWIFPTIEGGNYWHPLFSEFTKIFPQTIIYTGFWTGFASGYENSFKVELVGKMKLLTITESEESYSHSVMYVSPAIIGKLLKFKPHIVFANGFSAWTLLTILLKILTKWRVIIAYEGSTPNVDFRNSPIRLFFRRRMVQFADAFITNSKAGKTYLIDILGAKQTHTFARPYEVPTAKAMSKLAENSELNQQELQQPIFLFVGQLIPRKGLHLLLKACEILRQRGCSNYTLMIIGQGSDREKLENMSKDYGLEQSIKWIGWVDYNRIGEYFQLADVFILPTLEDTWGMVVLESMAYGKPILCSKWAGASELVLDGHNGYLFDPRNPEEVADAMYQFISTPDLIASFGRNSKQIIAEHTPETAAQFLAKVTNGVLLNSIVT